MEYKWAAMENFIPKATGELGKRVGFKQIPYKRRSFISRIKNWWSGNPTNVLSMITYNGTLYIGTDKGLYFYDGDKIKPVPIVAPKEDK